MMQTRSEEIAAAREFERLELAYWEEILSFPPAYELVGRVLRTILPQGGPEPLPDFAVLAREGSGAAAVRRQECARALRRADVDRDAMKAVLEALRAWPPALEPLTEAGPALDAPEYGRRVREAWLAQQSWKNHLVAARVRLVVAIARRYRFEHLTLEDLVQEGNLGLIKAVERFDHRFGFRFNTYASWWIRHAIKRAASGKSRAVRIPIHMVEVRSILMRAKQKLFAETGEVPTSDRLASATGIPVDKLELAANIPDLQLSLDASLSGAEDGTFKEQLEDRSTADPLDRMSIALWLERLPDWLDDLTPMEYQILRWRFGLENAQELTLQQIGDRYGYSRERARQLEDRALAKLRSRIEDRYGVSATPDEC